MIRKRPDLGEEKHRESRFVCSRVGERKYPPVVSRNQERAPASTLWGRSEDGKGV